MTIAGRTIAAATTMALVFSAAAQAATTKVVYMGAPTASQQSFRPYDAEVDNFFPAAIAIHVGDSVRFKPAGFHTVDLPVRGKKGQPLIVPAGRAVSGESDTAGTPFWFNAFPALGTNPKLLATLFGRNASYSGAARVESGLPLVTDPKPMTVKFTKAGAFTYYCDIHRGMIGTIRVLSARRHVPGSRSDAARVAKQVASAVRSAKTLSGERIRANTISVGAAGPNGVEVFGFLPETLTVPVGTTVTFRIAKHSREVHTATTGPGDPKSSGSYLGRLADGLNAPVFPGQSIYPSEPPNSLPATLTPRLHGNGFWSSGAMDAVGANLLPGTSQVTFGETGDYQFYCLIHPFMHATVTVR